MGGAGRMREKRSSGWEFATVAAVDLATRAFASSMEIALPVDVALAFMPRSPDVRTDAIVSWGRVTREELHPLVLLEEDPDALAQQLERLEVLLRDAAAHGSLVSLTFG